MMMQWRGKKSRTARQGGFKSVLNDIFYAKEKLC